MSSFCLTACNHFAIIAAVLHIWRIQQHMAPRVSTARAEQLVGTGTSAREMMRTDVGCPKRVVCSGCVSVPWFAKFIAACARERVQVGESELCLVNWIGCHKYVCE